MVVALLKLEVNEEDARDSLKLRGSSFTNWQRGDVSYAQMLIDDCT